MQPLQNPLLWVACPQAPRLCSPRKLDIKCAFGPSNHITELNHKHRECLWYSQKYIWQYCYRACYSAKRIMELLLGTLLFENWSSLVFGRGRRSLLHRWQSVTPWTWIFLLIPWYTHYISRQKRCNWGKKNIACKPTWDTIFVNMTENKQWTHNIHYSNRFDPCFTAWFV